MNIFDKIYEISEKEEEVETERWILIYVHRGNKTFLL